MRRLLFLNDLREGDLLSRHAFQILEGVKLNVMENASLSPWWFDRRELRSEGRNSPPGRVRLLRFVEFFLRLGRIEASKSR